MATYTIIGGDGKQYGPITADELRKWVSEGRLNAQSLAKAESDAEFRPLSAFPEFAEVFGIAAQMAGAPPPLGYGVAGGREAALQRVKGPAVALMVTAILYIILVVASWILLSAFGPKLQQFYSEMPNGAQMQKMLQSTNGPFAVAGDVLGLALSILILVGAVKMRSLRSYEFSITAAIVAMLPCVTPCCLIGLPFGIWALVVLTKPEVKSHFS
jgi:GYF domain 2